MKKYKKLTAAVLGVVMALSVTGFTVFAKDDTYAENADIEINSSEDLIDAIKNQRDGQTWILAEGEYDISDSIINEDFKINEETGFVFPITVDNLTIKAEKNADVLITSSYDPGKEQGGAWHNQNFITISGENVTIEGVNLRGNNNSYYDGCNKVIEVIDGGKNLTIKDVELLPLEDDEKSSGSIYFNVNNAGKCILKDVTMYSWVNAKAVEEGKVIVDNLVQDFRDNIYAGHHDSVYGYAWNPGVSGTNVEIEKFVIKADNKTKIDEQLFNSNLKDGTIIELDDGTYEVDKTILIDKDVTIEGNGSTIKVTTDISGSGNGANSAIEIEKGANVVIKDITIDGNKNVKHGINIFTSPSDEEQVKVELNGVTVRDCNGYGVVNNASDLTVTDIETSGNEWGGINVDPKAGNNASFTMNSGKITESNSVYFENTNSEAGASVEAAIKDGIFKGSVAVNGNNTDVTISGGTFEGKVMAADKESINIVSGTFTNDVNDYLDKDSNIVKDKDGNYVVMDEEEYEDYLDDKKSHGSSYELEEKKGGSKKDEKEEEPEITPAPEEEGAFYDLSKDDPNYDAIMTVYENGWMEGVSEGVFAPNGTLTRAMGVMVLWNKAGQPEPQEVAPFLDVTSDAWYAKAVAWAYEQGISVGYGDIYGPNDYLTTEQFTRMNDIANGRTPAVYIGGAPNATRGWVASQIA